MTDKAELIENLNNSFSSFWISKNIDIENESKAIPTNKFNACMMFIYSNYVQSLEIKTSKGLKKYNYIDYINLIEWYIAKSLDYDKISLFGFALLINRSVNFIYSAKNNLDNMLDSFIIEKDNILYLSSNNDDNIINDDVVLKTTCGGDGNLTLPIINATNKLFESLQYETVSKLNDTPLGLVTNANNNKDIGLMYAKERIQEQAKAKALISLSELPKLEEL